jgi:hypothetical protein
MRDPRSLLTALSGLWLAPLASAASAGELYRCARADDRVAYTNDASACPGAAAIEPPEDSVQRVTRPEPGAGARAERANPRPRARAPEPDAGQAVAWRNRKQQAEHERRAVAREEEALREFITHCNHGRDLFTVRENGLKRGISCESVRERGAELARRREELDRYLREELAEECRRAGCEPGWLR